MANGIYGHYLDNEVWNATVGGTSPSSSYSLSTYLTGVPAARVRYGATSATITLTFGSAITPTVFALPVSNATSITLNGSTIAVPTMPANRIPLTAIAQISLGSDTSWTIALSGPDNLIVGGCIWLGTGRTLDRNFRYGFHEIEDQPGPETTNDYGVEYIPFLDTQTRKFQCEFIASATGLAQLKAWHQDGRKRPSLFWPDVTVNDAYVGRWLSGFDAERQTAISTQARVSLVFGELCKGKPV